MLRAQGYYQDQPLPMSLVQGQHQWFLWY